MQRPPSPQTLALRLEAETAHRGGNFPEALRLYQKILTLDPGADDIWVHSAEIMRLTNQKPLAVQFLQKAVHINPDNEIAWHNLGFLHQLNEEWQAAAGAMEQAVRANPIQHKSLFILGNSYRALGRHQEAIAAYQAGLRHDPDDAEIWNNLGLAYFETLNYDAAAQAYLTALQHNINSISAHANLCILLLKVGQLEGARRSAERALTLDPNNHQVLNTLGSLEALLGQHELAIEYFRRAMAAEPGFWKAHSNLLFCALHKDGATLAEILALHQEWYQEQGTGFARKNIAFKNTSDPNRRLRVGFVSGDFRRHPVGYFVLNTMKRLAADNPFDLYFYANQYETDDLFAQAFHQIAGSRWRNIWEMKTEKLLQLIAEDEIDVLFDLTGQNDRHRLDIFCARAAPVQVTWAGYMATTGVPQMDWLLGDPIQTPPEDQPYYTERLYQMPNSFICYAPPPDAPPLAGAPPCIQNGYVTFASFNKPSKITARAIRVWSEAMQQLPDSRLLLKFSGFNDAETIRFFTGRFAAHGIAADRLMFEGVSPHRELLEKYNQVDMALDPMPYTGSTTTLEALWMGTPLVTLPGQIFPARHAASYLTSIGAVELIAADENDYVNKITALGRDHVRLRHYKQYLREQMRVSPLCDQDRFVPAFVQAVRHFWQDYCSRQG